MPPRDASSLLTVWMMAAFALLATCGAAAPSRRPRKRILPNPCRQEETRYLEEGRGPGRLDAGRRLWVDQFFSEWEGKDGDLPAFRFSSWKGSTLATLPDPPAAFGLYLDDTKVTDEGLKELVGSKFTSVGLFDTP